MVYDDRPPVIRRTLEYDPAEMAARGRIGGLATHSRHDSKELTRAGRAAFLSKFEREVDPGGTLGHEERQRRAAAARRDYFTHLARLSARARTRPVPLMTAASSIEAEVRHGT